MSGIREKEAMKTESWKSLGSYKEVVDVASVLQGPLGSRFTRNHDSEGKGVRERGALSWERPPHGLGNLHCAARSHFRPVCSVAPHNLPKSLGAFVDPPSLGLSFPFSFRKAAITLKNLTG